MRISFHIHLVQDFLPEGPVAQPGAHIAHTCRRRSRRVSLENSTGNALMQLAVLRDILLLERELFVLDISYTFLVVVLLVFPLYY